MMQKTSAVPCGYTLIALRQQTADASNPAVLRLWDFMVILAYRKLLKAIKMQAQLGKANRECNLIFTVQDRSVTRAKNGLRG